MLFGVQVRPVVHEAGQPLDAVLERGAVAFDQLTGVVPAACPRRGRVRRGPR